MDDGPRTDDFLLDALSGCSFFGTTEPIADIAGQGAIGDLYLSLARTIEREVIPRLLLNTRLEIGRRDAALVRARDRQAHDVTVFCDIVLTRELDDAKAYIIREIADGMSQESLLLDLLAPTARRLGELWETDECSFVDVTFALGRLQQLLRLFSETCRREPEPAKLGFRALLATVPDNQHFFGILVVEELFRRAGWNALSLPSPDRSELLDLVARDWFGVVGLSISCDASARSTAPLIEEIRKASLNRSVLVLVGGRYVDDNPGPSKLMGADLAGADAHEAIQRSGDFLRSIGR